MSLKNKNIAIVLGGLTLILFSVKPYIINLIEPNKSIGQVIGENAKDLIDILKGKNEIKHSNSKLEIWSHIITILAFIMFSLTIFFSAKAFQKAGSNWLAIAGVILSFIGLGIYLSHLTIGLIGVVVIAFLVVSIVTLDVF